MNWLDIIILCIVLFSAIKGLWDGLIKQAFLLIGLVVAIFCTRYLTPNVESIFNQYVHLSEQTSHIVSLGLTFILILITVGLIGLLVDKFVSHTPLAIFNRLGGFLLGIIIPVILLSYIFIFIESIYPTPTSLTNGDNNQSNDIRVESKLYTTVKSVVPTFIAPHLLYKGKELREEINNALKE